MGLLHAIRYSASRALCLLLALHFLNLSVDSTDPHPDYIAEDLSVNDIESVVELFAEVVLGLDNIFAEHDETDHHGQSSHTFKLFLVNPVSAQNSSSLHLLCDNTFFVKNISSIETFITGTSTPPPKV